MKKIFITLVSFLMLCSPAFAEKPEWAGKGKPTAEQREAHKTAMEAKLNNDEVETAKEKIKKEKSEWVNKGKSKNEQKEAYKAKIQEKLDNDNTKNGKAKIKKEKSDKREELELQNRSKPQDVQKELDKGSDKGRESRDKRRKWWKFWGE